MIIQYLLRSHDHIFYYTKQYFHIVRFQARCLNVRVLTKIEALNDNKNVLHLLEVTNITFDRTVINIIYT